MEAYGALREIFAGQIPVDTGHVTCVNMGQAPGLRDLSPKNPVINQVTTCSDTGKKNPSVQGSEPGTGVFPLKTHVNLLYRTILFS
jgi:hypothetical protein